jgi:hypothetical protein
VTNGAAARRTLSHRENLLELLSGGNPERVPWFADLDYLTAALIGTGRREAGFRRSDDYLAWHRELDAGFYLQGFFPFEIEFEGCEITETREGHDRRRTVKTPKGTLTEMWRYLPGSFTEAPVEHLVKGEEDLPAYRYLYEHTRYRADYSFAELRKRQIGDLGINLCYTPRSPFMRMAVIDAGIETLAVLALTAKEELDSTIVLMRERLSEAVDIACAAPVDAVMIPENLSSEVIGKRFFHDYLEEIQSDWVSRIDEAGRYSFIHIDGSLRGLLAEEAAVGFTVLEAITPAPVGDLRVDELADFIDPSPSVLWGGVPGSFFTRSVSESEFEEHVISALEVMKSEPRYVLGVADQVPPDGLEERVARVGELVRRYGRYSPTS